MRDEDKSIPADLAADEAAARVWEIVVIGAGPAGAVLADAASQRGARVLLVDKSSFPRFKVCGGCLNHAGLETLRACGLGDAVAAIAAPALTKISLAVGRSVANLELPAGIVVSRSAFDASLILAARRAGTAFLPQTVARVGSPDGATRRITLATPHGTVSIRSRMVVVADGLGGQALREQPAFDWVIAPDSRIGGGVEIHGGSDAYARGVIHMAVQEGGYVGVARGKSDQLIIGAAMDAAAARGRGSMAALATDILKSAGFPAINALEESAWRGTATLSRHRPIAAAERLLVIGDAAGYVEPFTGQGMAWALQSAADAVEPTLAGVARWRGEISDSWNLRHARRFGSDRALCRWIARGLRRPLLTRLAVRALATMPRLASPIIGRVSRVGVGA